MHISRNRNTGLPAAPQGVTLLELLAVCTISLLISGAVLRAIAPALAGRQVREAARMVNVFINSARNRAIESGRPSGVWLDRLSNMNEACVSLAYAQVPQPYSGDYTDSMLEAFIIPNGYLQAGGPEFFLNVVVPSGLTNATQRQGMTPVRPETWSYADGSQKFVRQGDLLQLNLQGKPYRLISNSDMGGPYWVIAIGVNNSSGLIYSASGKPQRVGPGGPFTPAWKWSQNVYSIGWYNDLGVQVTPFVTPGSTMTHVGTPVPYQIVRQPMRMSAGSLQLPETTCIDLNFSGNVDTTIGGQVGSYSYPLFRPFHPRFDPSDSTVPPSPYRGNAWDPTDQTPVIITFNPTGSVEQVYCRYWQWGQSNSSSPWVWRGDSPIALIHLLVGSFSNGSTPHLPFNPALNPVTLQQCNVCDPKNVWVTIHPLSGEVTSNEVRMVQFATSSGSAGNTGSTYTVNTDMRFTGTGGLLWTSIQGALAGDTMGGR